jgi:hypothetical protein
MNARSFETRYARHYRFSRDLCPKTEPTTRDLFSVGFHCKILEIIVAEKVWGCILEAKKIFLLYQLNKSLFGIWP